MSLRSEFSQSHPEFPLLSEGDTAGIDAFLRENGWLEEGETVTRCDRAGEGNMNLTLRIDTSQRSFILKQARPWVEKYDHIAAPWDRMHYEQRFYERISPVPGLAGKMPKFLAANGEARVVLLEDLKDATDFTDLYGDAFLSEGESAALGHYVGELHECTHGDPDPLFANREMRDLNHEHVFIVPLDPENGLDLDAFEAGLKDAAELLQNDNMYREAVGKVGDRYRADGPCLVHGDYFPGSWLRFGGDIRIIDPEFCFYGDAEFDVGVALAHFRMADQDRSAADTFLSSYNEARGGAVLDMDWVARYASVEIMRRIIGVAQLPLPESERIRAHLLRSSHDAMLKLSLEALWS